MPGRLQTKTQPKLGETIATLKEYEITSCKGENMIYLPDSETNIVMITTILHVCNWLTEEVELDIMSRKCMIFCRSNVNFVTNW